MHARRRRARESHGWLITAAVEQGRSRATVLLGSSLSRRRSSSSSLSRVFSSIAAARGARARRAGGDGRRARDARSARASRVVDHRRSRAGAFAHRAALLLLGSSLVPSVAPRARRSLTHPPSSGRGG